METSRTNQSSSGTRPAWVIDSASVYSKMKEYNGLQDTNLRAYFSNKRRRGLLVKAGLLATMKDRQKNTEPSPLRGRDSREKLLGEKRSLEVGKTPEPNRNVYSSANRSRSVRGPKTAKLPGKKPLTHEELQHLFEKYRQKVTIPEASTHLPTGLAA